VLMPESWYPRSSRLPGFAEPPENFMKRMEEWHRSFDASSDMIPPPPQP
jgi:hypothetical protein